MAFGFVCFELDGVTQQNIAAIGSPCFVRELPATIAPAGGSRCFFQGVLPGVAPYASTTLLRPALVAGLVGASPDFIAVDFFENEAGAVTITLNAAGEISALAPLDASQLAPGVVSAVRVSFSGGVYCDVQGTLATVAAALGTGGSGAAGPSNVAFVDVNGTALGAVGDASRPFATVAQAIAALAAVVPQLASAQVRIGPGTFLGDIPPIPPSLTDLSIIGSTTTVVQTLSVGGILFDLGVNVKRSNFACAAFQAAAPGGLVVRYDGGAQLALGSAFQTGALALAGGFVALAGDVDVRRCGTLATFNAQLYGDTLVQTVIQWLQIGSLVNNVDLLHDYDDPNLPPGSSLIWTVQNASTVLGNVKLAKQATVEGDGSRINGTLSGNGLSDSLSLLAGSVVWRDGFIQDVDLSTPGAQIPDSLLQWRFDFSDTTIGQNFTASVVAPAVNFQRVTVAGALFRTLGPVIGSGIHADARGATSLDPNPVQGFYTSGTGDIIPPPFATAPTPVVANPQPILLPFRLAGTGYAVALDADNATTLPLAVTARTATQIDATVSLIAGNLRALVQWVG